MTFETVDQFAGDAIVDRNRPQPVKGRRVGNGLTADNTVSMIEGQWNSKNFAIRALYEAHIPPAIGAKRAISTSHPAAGGTGRWIDDVKDRSKSKPPHRLNRSEHGKQPYTSTHEVDFSFERVPLRERYERRLAE